MSFRFDGATGKRKPKLSFQFMVGVFRFSIQRTYPKGSISL